jgi:hypothetical protein
MIIKLLLGLMLVLSLNSCSSKIKEIDLPNGDKYVGEYKNGKMHGQGTYTGANGASYVGEYKNDMMNGQGTYTGANGASYVGEFKNDMWHGQGTLVLADGNSFVGEWKDNHLTVGTVYDKDGILLFRIPEVK